MKKYYSIEYPVVTYKDAVIVEMIPGVDFHVIEKQTNSAPALNTQKENQPKAAIAIVSKESNPLPESEGASIW